MDISTTTATGQRTRTGRARTGRQTRTGQETRTGQAWRDAAAEALAVLLPVECAGCGEPDRAVCVACRDELAATARCVRLVAGVRLDAAFEYAGVARTLLLALKVHGRVDVAWALGRPTVRTLDRARAAAPDAVVVRIPPSPAGLRRRGWDPVVLLLGRGGVRVRRRLVRRHGGVGRGASSALGSQVSQSQKSRSAVERVTATVGTLRAVGVSGRRVILVDDVVTTGVTMAEGVRAVRAAGGTVVRCVATASVEP
ncbi:ComF family protein [Curtobacterium sp. RRHDQ10]|uniref:ComF family protein n=1 Tax=Curtobacterium phyllosphaerae TaxID=3413379 RepID=UPI003BF3C0A5